MLVRSAILAMASLVLQPAHARDAERHPFEIASVDGPSALLPPAGGEGAGGVCRNAAARWAEVRDLADPAAFEDYLRRFPGCAYTDLARQHMMDLRASRDLAVSETECDRLASSEGDPFKLPTVKGVDFYEIDSPRAIAACGEAIGRHPSEARFFYPLGRALDNAGRYEEALVQYRKSADLGNPQAMRNLGILYENGEGTARDYGEAMVWFRRAADLGSGLAMNNVGLLYRRGNGVEENLDTALEWYRRSAEKGVAVAMLNIGDFYDLGLSVKQDFAEALAWYRKAAAAGDVPAMTNIGYAYESGRGVAQDDEEAMTWYRKAAERDHAQAWNNIGTFYEAGRTVRKDIQEALAWYLKAAEKGNGYGAHNAAVLYDDPKGPKLDPKEAARLVEAALRAGHEISLKQMKENSRAWTLAFRREFQQRLTDAGVYTGRIDGQFGPSTIAAVEAIYEKAQ